MAGIEQVDRGARQALPEVALALGHKPKIRRQKSTQDKSSKPARGIDSVSGDVAVARQRLDRPRQVLDKACGKCRALFLAQWRRQTGLRFPRRREVLTRWRQPRFSCGSATFGPLTGAVRSNTRSFGTSSPAHRCRLAVIGLRVVFRAPGGADPIDLPDGESHTPDGEQAGRQPAIARSNEIAEGAMTTNFTRQWQGCVDRRAGGDTAPVGDPRSVSSSPAPNSAAAPGFAGLHGAHRRQARVLLPDAGIGGRRQVASRRSKACRRTPRIRCRRPGLPSRCRNAATASPARS